MKKQICINFEEKLVEEAREQSKKLCKYKAKGSFSAYVEQAVYERLIADGVDPERLLSNTL